MFNNTSRNVNTQEGPNNICYKYINVLIIFFRQ
jgi:hypothetical protein